MDIDDQGENGNKDGHKADGEACSQTPAMTGSGIGWILRSGTDWDHLGRILVRNFPHSATRSSIGKRDNRTVHRRHQTITTSPRRYGVVFAAASLVTRWLDDCPSSVAPSYAGIFAVV